MAAEIVQVDSNRVVIGLNRFHLSLQQNDELMQQIGNSQLVSVRRTFREQGSPARSWAPLAPSTIRRDPKRYGAGHKILIQHGRLLNSIKLTTVAPGKVVIGTNLIYAAVHQFGSCDRTGIGAAIGPLTEAASKMKVNVGEHSYRRVSADLGSDTLRGHRRLIRGPRNARMVKITAHSRRQNILPRPYLVFRPEDPRRIRGLVVVYVNKAKQQAGLESK